jgi:hypothetical protein
VLRKQKGRTSPFSSPPTRRHEFAIGPAGPHDPFDGRGQRYTCIRCKWAFVVKGRQVVVLDDRGIPMPGEQAVARLDTFAQGPCPGIRTPEGHPPQLQITGKRKP